MVSVIHDLRISNLVFEYTDKVEQKNYSCLAVADYRFLNILKLKDRVRYCREMDERKT